MSVYFRIREKSDKEPAIYISQGDEGQRISLLLPDLGVSLSRDDVYKMEGTKPSGKTVVVPCEYINHNVLNMNVTKELSDEAGTVRAQVVIYGNEGQRAGSETILIMVEPLGGIA